MKILAIGDFHGEFPRKIIDIVKKEKIDCVVSNGDYFPFHYRKLWFKHCYGKDLELWEVIGKEKFRQMILKDLRMGEKSLNGLNKLPVPVYTIIGNNDYTNLNDQYKRSRRKSNKVWDWCEQNFFWKIIKKYRNIKLFYYSAVDLGDVVLIGGYGGTSPGRVTSSAYKNSKNKLDKLFRKFRGRKIIFVAHNVPYNTKIDKIGKDAHAKARGKHYGSKLVRRTIEKWKPELFIGGHIHEGFGKDKIGKTLCLNIGSAHDGQGAIIEVPEDGKMKVRFIK